MAVGHFIKDNLALVAGIAVPVVLVAGFLLTSTIARLLSDPPAYTAYFILKETDHVKKPGILTVIKVNTNGTLSVTATPYPESKNGHLRPTQTDILVSYDSKSDTLTEHRFETPVQAQESSFTPDAFKDIRLSTQSTAPDGYRVAYASRGSKSLVADIFVPRRAAGYRLRKGSAIYRLPDRPSETQDTGNYYSLRFLGWGMEKSQ